MTTDILNQIMDYEAGELELEDTIQLFAYLVATGMAWTLQGHYGSTAMHLIDSGLLDRNGVIMHKNYLEEA
jgi:hypothetical protein